MDADWAVGGTADKAVCATSLQGRLTSPALHYPRFYEAFRDYNLANPDAPLYLLHGIWLDEENPDPFAPDLHHLEELFDRGIIECVSAVHGDIEIDHRFGRAYGVYSADISPWVMGWIIGREIYPDEVEFTNTLQPGDTTYEGTHVSLPEGTPTECWLAERVDFVARYEDENYGSGRPISASSWPTLDPLRHPTESQWSYEDTHWFELANLDTTWFPPGYFASFHAYPYYPDWMSEDIEYVDYVDAEGTNSYLGYLTALRNHYYPKPLIIAEFGVPSSWGNAHVAQGGMHHGGHDEVEQGHYAVRMFDNLVEAGCAGGALFAWIDEWWKNTWITEFIEFPLLSRPIWSAQLYVTEAYDLFGIWHDRWNYITNALQLYHSIPTDGAAWSRVRWLSNRQHASDDWVHVFPETVDEIGRLRVSPVRDFVSAMDDDRGTPQRETTVSDGIRLTVVHAGLQAATGRLLWEQWELPPPTVEREKDSVAVIERYLRSLGTPEALNVWIVSRTEETVTLDWTQGGILEIGETVLGPWHKPDRTSHGCGGTGEPEIVPREALMRFLEGRATRVGSLRRASRERNQLVTRP